MIIATRGSKLALWQARYVARLCRVITDDTTLLELKTQGDVVQDQMLHEMGGKGLFVKALELALLDHRADLAVHSLKDLPVRGPDGLEITAYLKRHASGDVLLLRQPLPAPFSIKAISGAVIGTGSLRRGCLLREAGFEGTIEGIRGNVDTRIQKLKAGAWDGIILAAASIERLKGLADGVTSVLLDPKWFVPSPSQGILALQVRSGSFPLLSQLDDPETRLCADWERGVLRALGGDCTMPIGAHASKVTGGWQCNVVVLHEGESARVSLTIPDLDVNAAMQALVKAGVNRILRSLGLPEVAV